MPSFHGTSLSIATLVAGHLATICATPPHKSPSTPTSEQKQAPKLDRIKLIVDGVGLLARLFVPILFIYQALITLLIHHPSLEPKEDEGARYSAAAILSSVCMYPDRLYHHHQRFTWTSVTAGSILAIVLGTIARLAAYGGLGRNFTFRLTMPDRLITHGVYAHVQHPSYTGLMLANVGCVGLVVRWDAAPGACWVPAEMVSGLRGWGMGLTLTYLGCFAGLLAVRVRDEERMLKQRFGDGWEEWHRRTPRLLPWLV